MVVLAVTLCSDLFFTRVFSVSIPQDRIDEINAMPHQQALSELSKLHKPVRGLPYILRAYPNPMTWKAKATPMAIIFIFAFGGCLWMGVWSAKRERESPQPQD